MKFCPACKIQLTRHSDEQPQKFRERRFCSQKCGRIGTSEKMGKLTPDQVRLIRVEAASGDANSKIASRYGVTQATIWAIAMGRTWRHVK